MAKPLRSSIPNPPSTQFSHFGVLEPVKQNKASIATSMGINAALLLIFVILSAAAVKVEAEKKAAELTYVVPPAVKPPPPPKPRLVPPKPLPKPPEIKLPEPKIILPKVVPPAPKPVPVTMPTPPKPIATPAPPKIAIAAAAPKPVAVNLGKSASVPNHDLHPAAVSLGSPTNPIAPSNRPATATVNLGQSGLAGMPPGTGRGPSATAVNLGSGQPGGSLAGNRPQAVQGVKLGVPGGTPGGTGNANFSRPQQVALGQRPPSATTTQPVATTKMPVAAGPKVLYKPQPVYTAEARQAKIEGLVSVRIKVSAAGAVTVVGVTNGLGHGLDESAIRAVQATRFKPALDANGSPIDWEGVVNISFQLAG